MNNKYSGNDDFPDREATLKHLRERSRPKDYDQYDELSKRAFRGLQSLESPGTLEDSLRRLDQRFDQRLQPRERPSTFGRLSGKLRIAASILIILVPAAAWFLLRQPAVDTADAGTLFKEHFAPIPSAIPLSGTLRGPEESGNLKREGIKAYEAAYYEKAISSFEAYLDQHPDDTEIRFYYGISLLAREEAAAAIAQLSQVYQQPPRQAYRPAAAWYLGLAYLQNGQEQQAAQYLEELAKDQDNDYWQQAIRLLKQLGYDVSSVGTTNLPGLGARTPPIVVSPLSAPFF